MKRVNIDRDVQSHKRIAVSRPAPTPEQKPEIMEVPKYEPQEEQKPEEPKETDTPEPDAGVVSKAKKGGRSASGDV